jgi:hypothetical protein
VYNITTDLPLIRDSQLSLLIHVNEKIAAGVMTEDREKETGRRGGEERRGW